MPMSPRANRRWISASQPVLHPADMAGIGHEDVEDELEGRIAQLFQEGGGQRVAEHVRIVLGDRQQQVDDLVRVGAVGHATRMRPEGSCPCGSSSRGRR